MQLVLNCAPGLIRSVFSVQSFDGTFVNRLACARYSKQNKVPFYVGADYH